MDTEKYRFQKFISDISGQDIKAHGGEPRQAVRIIREWLNAASRRRTIPGGNKIWSRYMEYQENLPALCDEAALAVEEMTFNDKADFAYGWLTGEDLAEEVGAA